MFSALYENYLSDIPLVRLSPSSSSSAQSADSTTTASDMTLADVMRSSRYVLFCVLRGGELADRPKNLTKQLTDFLGCVRALMVQQNNGPVKNLETEGDSSPKRLRKLLKSLRFSKKSTTSGDDTNRLNVSTVILDLEPTAKTFDICVIKDPGFYFMPLDLQSQYFLKGRLLRALNFVGVAPAVVVVDAVARCVLTSQGRRMLGEDPAGEHFPWIDPSPADLFTGPFLRNVCQPPATNNRQQPVQYVAESHDFAVAPQPRVKALFLGAKWCPPCREVVKQLIGVYGRLKAALGDDFELFFCSSDQTEESFYENFATMPWCALPFGKERLTQLTRAYNIGGIPSVVLVDQQNRLFSRYARSVMLSDPDGQRFPWRRQPLIELNEFNIYQIADGISLILFTEGQPDDASFAQNVLRSAAETLYAERQPVDSKRKEDENAKNGQPENEESERRDNVEGDKVVQVLPTDYVQVFYTGDDPICDHILERFGQEDIPLPLLLICDMHAGHMAVCDLPDVTELIVAGFVDDYRTGNAKVVPLPTPPQHESNDTAGTLIEHLLLDEPQPGKQSSDEDVEDQ